MIFISHTESLSIDVLKRSTVFIYFAARYKGGNKGVHLCAYLFIHVYLFACVCGRVSRGVQMCKQVCALLDNV